MKRTRSTAAGLVLCLLCGSSLISCAQAFKVRAHEAVSMTTLSGLSTSANQALKKLLNGKDLADVAGWAHRVSDKYPDTARLHFMSQPTCPSKPLRTDDIILDKSFCEVKGNCLLEALTYFFFHLVDPDQNKVEQTNPDVITTTNFVFPHDIKTTDADAVKYIINLVGDMHQPLHMGSADDDYGRRAVVQYSDGEQMRLTTLYNFLEAGLVDKTVKQRQYFWFSGWTHVNSVKGAYDSEKSLFATNKEKMFSEWAKENRAVLCNEVYPHVRKTGKDARAAANALGSDAVDEYAKAVLDGSSDVPLFEIDAAAEFALFQVLKKRILLAGARVAIVMNYILQVRESKDLGKLRQGSGVADVVDSIDPPLAVENMSMVYLKNFLTNFAIFLVILLFFVYISRFYSTPPAHALQRGGSSPTTKLPPTGAPAGGRRVEMECMKDS
ncbi:S1/P1nuclease [Toxoplasma gondii GAB2-2007-GAL-DOM2]|uniref:S1/P1nuclease n=6 Tax=Toxoplasma gondii TaxID=5811 RepID=S7URY7_TOXGG|nr:S1/P1nuclease [Toxoplasma gondii GT1]KAF4643421.1 S1/P1nuclease [Toxoplasma gondii]KFG39526.1 S1/P1nuclease [Toxoplasma gondii GAB2-2007-GAL-DOM2]KFG48537.1 S1/P1nuclease [Toxoplasma gondii FOU]KFH04298.1 S1/P1nuclease [Toxoplasma gondii VAND]RQX70806.1 S1/P1nuclease [Toxoplasma gondii CAST]